MSVNAPMTHENILKNPHTEFKIHCAVGPHLKKNWLSVNALFILSLEDNSIERKVNVAISKNSHR